MVDDTNKYGKSVWRNSLRSINQERLRRSRGFWPVHAERKRPYVVAGLPFSSVLNGPASVTISALSGGNQAESTPDLATNPLRAISCLAGTSRHRRRRSKAPAQERPHHVAVES